MDHLDKWQDIDKQFWVNEKLAYFFAENLRRDEHLNRRYRIHKFMECEA
jgi:hypothetical protein